jgi:hypothetical protein
MSTVRIATLDSLILGFQEMAFLLEPPMRADDAYHALVLGR